MELQVVTANEADTPYSTVLSAVGLKDRNDYYPSNLVMDKKQRVGDRPCLWPQPKIILMNPLHSIRNQDGM